MQRVRALGGRPLGGYPRGFRGVRRRGSGGGDPSLQLDYNYLLDSGSTISQSVKRGPVPTFTRASDSGDFTSDGTWALVGGNDLPVYGHDPNDSNAQLGMGMWSSRTQIGHKTSDLSDAVWTTLAVNADVPSSVEDDIFGTSLGSELACTATADQAVSLAQAYTGLTANTTTAVAAYVKTGTNATFVQLAWDDAGGGADGCFCNFQLTGAGTKGTPTALAAGDVVAARTTIELTTDGFYRCVLVGDIDVGTTARFTISIVDEIGATVFQAANLADNDSLIVNAIDVQVGILITPHIPNAGGAGTSVTRAKDVCSTTDVSFFNATAGTWIASWRKAQKTTGLNAYILRIETEGGASDNPLQEISTHSGAERINFDIFNVSAADADINITNTAEVLNATNTVGVAYAEDDAAGTLNGDTTFATDSTVGAETGHDEFHIGSNDSNNLTYLDGYVQDIRFLNVRKPNAFLVTETT